MKLCRYDDDRLGLVIGSEVADVTSVLNSLPSVRYPLPREDLLIASLGTLRAEIEAAAAGAERTALSRVRLLSPVANSGKLVAAPVNYAKHLDEVRADRDLHHDMAISAIHDAGLFLKATSSLIGCSHGVQLAQPWRRTDHEIELAVIIGKQGKHVREADAMGLVAGYAIGLDMTIRGPEERSMRKSPDSYSVLGPYLVTADEIRDPGALVLRLSVNGQVRQHASTHDLVMSVPALIAFATKFYSLHPGDVLFTGTPEGVGPVVSGDTIEACIEGIGEMSVQVRSPGEQESQHG